MVANVSMKDQMKKLVDLQKIDGEIYSIKQDLKERPAQVDALKVAFEEKKAHLKSLEDKSKALQLVRKQHELDLKGKEDDIIKANGKLSELKTNKEYQAKLSEIESIKADKSVIEEKILISYDDGDAIIAEIEKEKLKVAENDKRYQAQKKEVDDAVKVLEDRLKVLDSQRQQTAPDLDLKFKLRYEKLLGAREGLAIVPVIKGNSCGGCNLNISPQKANAIRMGQELIECEFCARILYLEDDD
jgi:predicted  nucleic acid-binding Zn-ribbon protein